MRQVGQTFTDLLQVIPPVTEELHPLGAAILTTADDLAKVTGATTGWIRSFEKNSPASTQNTFNFLRSLDHETVTLTNHIPGARAVNNWLTDFQHWVSGTSAPTQRTAAAMQHMALATGDLIHPLSFVNSGLLSASKAEDAAAHKAYLAATSVRGLADAVQHLNTQLSNAVGPNSTFNKDLIGTATSAAAAEKALDGTHNKIGLNTAAQRNAFGAQQTYIDNLVTLTKDAGDNRQKQDEATAAIKRALPSLSNVTGGTRQYWQEVRTLVSWLHTEQQFKKLSTLITVNGQGVWHIAPGHGLPGGTAGGPFAAGGRVPAGFPNDTYLARLTSGEAVVDPVRTKALAPALKAAGVPGFGAGGVVGSYSGGIPGLTSWTHHNFSASITSVTDSIAQSFAASFKRAFSSFGGAGGPAGGSAAANMAIGRRMFPWPAFMWPAQVALWNRESGWNRFAYNAGSGATGIPQALPFSKMPRAAWLPSQGGSANAAAQIGWGYGYERGRYGTPLNAWAHEEAFGWYDHGGWIRPGRNVLWNGTGRMEHLVPAQGGGQKIVLEITSQGSGTYEQLLLEALRRSIRVRGGNVQVVLGRP
jgi:hypothetical protein